MECVGGPFLPYHVFRMFRGFVEGCLRVPMLVGSFLKEIPSFLFRMFKEK